MRGVRRRSNSKGDYLVGFSERRKEINRRRHRRKKLARFEARLKKATVSEKAHIADKIRALTPGCDVVISRMDLEKR